MYGKDGESARLRVSPVSNNGRTGTMQAQRMQNKSKEESGSESSEVKARKKNLRAVNQQCQSVALSAPSGCAEGNDRHFSTAPGLDESTILDLRCRVSIICTTYP